MNKKWEVVIGLEVHVELATDSKIFCSCSTKYTSAPNTHCCPVCMGLPGTLPVLNEQVLDYAIRAGIALNCKIEKNTRFDRKNYFYPDLPKAYQISQLYRPIASDGYVEINVEGIKKHIRIREMHMEEDAGKLVHSIIRNETYPDYNRCGVPLLEIVSEPDFRSSNEVSAYLEQIKMIFSYLDIVDFKKQEGAMRADVNLSVREMDCKEYGTRTEMKNINSIAAIIRAIDSEASRQIDLLNSGKHVVQETRHWDDEQRSSYAMRGKENAQDYRYFPEPDIPPIIVTEDMIDKAKEAIPEFKDKKTERFVTQYDLSENDAALLCCEKKRADFFESLVAGGINSKIAFNWTIEYLSKINKELFAEETCFSVHELVRLIKLVEEGNINRKDGISILKTIISGNGPDDVEKYVVEHNLLVSNDMSELIHAVRIVLENNKKAVDDFLSGKDKVIGFLVGQVMKETMGKYSPPTVKDTVLQEIKKM